MILYSSIIIITGIDLLFFQTPISFFGNAIRLQGIFLLWMLMIFSFISTTVNSKITYWWVYCLLLYIELIVTLFLPMDASHRYVGTLGEPNALAGFIVFLFPFGWFGLSNAKHEVIKKILLVLPIIVLLYLTWSRSGMVAFGIELLFIFLRKMKVSTSKDVNSMLICLFS